MSGASVLLAFTPFISSLCGLVFLKGWWPRGCTSYTVASFSEAGNRNWQARKGYTQNWHSIAPAIFFQSKELQGIPRCKEKETLILDGEVAESCCKKLCGMGAIAVTFLKKNISDRTVHMLTFRSEVSTPLW